MRINSSLALFKIFLIIQFLAIPTARCSFDSHEFEQRIAALFRVVQFMVQRPQQMNVDGVFGMTLAEANLLATLHHPNAQLLDPQHRFLLTKILRSLYEARVEMKKIVLPETSDVAFINEILNDPSLWRKPIIWQSTTLGHRPEPTPGLDESMASKLIYTGSPQEKESDSCLKELLMSAGESKECRVSNNCSKMLLRDDNPAGYPLTHRLLFVQTARAIEVKCWQNQSSTFTKLNAAYCQEILQNLVDLETLNFPGASRDLAIEQVLLCGMEGFLDFVNDHYAKLFRSWAHPEGCYNSQGFTFAQKNPTNSNLRRGKRSSGKMDFGCENHTSGLAAGSFALLIRESVENDINPIFNHDENHVTNFNIDLPSLDLINKTH